MLPLLRAVVLAAALFPAAAQAQSVDGAMPGEENAFDGDYLVVGAGLALIPSYEGSDDGTVILAGGVTGRIGGVGIGARSGGISLDLIDDPAGQKVGFALGPVARWRGNRTAHIVDSVVQRLGTIRGTVETGIAAGVEVHRVLTPVDTLSFSGDARWDITGRGGGQVSSFSLSYFTPVSRAAAAGLAVTADRIDDTYANYNYAIDAAGSIASGLPTYSAHGGWKSFGARAFAAYDLNGNLLDGGLAVAAGASWNRLYGSAAETPMTSLRGSSSQWLFGAGLAYTF